MRRSCRPGGAALLGLAVGLSACASPVGSPAPDVPLFVPDQQEVKFYQTLAREQDRLLATCGQLHSCDRAHFTRALVALFESRETAAMHFQQVLAVAPKSRLASTSQVWLRLLQDARSSPGRSGPFGSATERLVRDLLERERLIQQLTMDREEDMASLQVLRGDMTTREKKAEELAKKVEELTSQLEALKRIDREVKEKIRPPKPTSKVVPKTKKGISP